MLIPHFNSLKSTRNRKWHIKTRKGLYENKQTKTKNTQYALYKLC